jgi:hypothetical protein
VAVDRGVPVQADALNEIRAMTIRRELAPPCTSMSVRPPGWCSKPDVSLMPVSGGFQVGVQAFEACRKE